jgi:hypothetical protein
MSAYEIDKMKVQLTSPVNVNKSILTIFFTLSLKYAGK